MIFFLSLGWGPSCCIPSPAASKLSYSGLILLRLKSKQCLKHSPYKFSLYSYLRSWSLFGEHKWVECIYFSLYLLFSELKKSLILILPHISLSKITWTIFSTLLLKPMGHCKLSLYYWVSNSHGVLHSIIKGTNLNAHQLLFSFE